MHTPLLSIVIPVCGTEQYVDRCLESVLEGNYADIEVIVVNDGSKGDIDTRILAYTDPRIRYVREENQGLFAARLLGAMHATGTYLAFLDSDDAVSYDYYTNMVMRAERTNADLVIGSTVWVEDGQKLLYNLHESLLAFDVLSGQEARERYFSQELLCYSWHTIWNKLIRRDLWERCLPYYAPLHGHIVMTEDVAFSTVLFCEAKTVAREEHGAYFYYRNETSATGGEMPYGKLRKHIRDMDAVFGFVDTYLETIESPKAYRRHMKNARAYYGRIWQHRIEHTLLSPDRKQKLLDAVSAFGKEKKRCIPERDFFLSSVKKSYKGGLSYLAEEIGRGKEHVVSFDLFDTLLVRPFYHPEDLHDLLDAAYAEKTGSHARFSLLRKDAEEHLRALSTSSAKEDVTLSEIYEELTDHFGIPKAIAQEMEAYEEELELRFVSVRKSGQALYDSAVHAGKRVVFVTDMYLPRPLLEKMLLSFGFSGSLYLSGEARKLKASGQLFAQMLKKERTNGSNVLHIGDSWVSDVEGAQKAGIRCLFLPSAREVFEGRVEGYGTGRLQYFAKAEDRSSTYMDALLIRRFLDDPYRSFSGSLDADPVLFGYGPLGRYLYAIGRWILDACRKMGKRRILFLARDGYLPMQAVRIISEAEGTQDITFAYLPVSRKALLPMMLKDMDTLFDLPVSFRSQTPRSMLDLLDFANGKSAKETEKILHRASFAMEKQFRDRVEYVRFLQLFWEELYEKGKHEDARRTCCAFFQDVTPDDVLFDLGYSGRIQQAISDAAGFPVDALYLSEDGVRSQFLQRSSGIRISTFHEHTPPFCGLVREYLMSDTGPYCIGYQMGKDGTAIPVMEDPKKDTLEVALYTAMMRAALDFVRDYVSTFPEASGKEHESPSHFLTRVLLDAGEDDLSFFRAFTSEDAVYGNVEHIDLLTHLLKERAQEETKEQPPKMAGNPSVYSLLIGKNKMERALVYLIFDRKLFWAKLKKNLRLR